MELDEAKELLKKNGYLLREYRNDDNDPDYEYEEYKEGLRNALKAAGIKQEYKESFSWIYSRSNNNMFMLEYDYPERKRIKLTLTNEYDAEIHKTFKLNDYESVIKWIIENIE